MMSTSKKVFINLAKLSRNKALWTTGIVASIGASIYYIDKNNAKRFKSQMVIN